MAKIRVCICGFGQIGRRFARRISARGDMELAAVIDHDQSLVGEQVRNLIRDKRIPDLRVLPDIFSIDTGDADICVVTTSSSGSETGSVVLDILKRRLPIITTCEEFAFLEVKYPELAQEIDRVALDTGVAVLGTGINPGFLMDALPVMLSGCTTDIRSITVERVQDAAVRRLQFQKKIGAGLSAEEFKVQRDNGVIRHVGFEESARLIAKALSLPFDRGKETVEMVKSSRRYVYPGAVEVRRGAARGIDQTYILYSGSRAVIKLRLRAAIGEPESFDRIVIDGTPRIDSRIAGGVNGDDGTCAVLINAIRALKAARPVGLLTMLDFPLIPGVSDRREK